MSVKRGASCYHKNMQKFTAIVIASREANEFDRIYTFYSREIGIIRASGKGVRKPEARLAGHLEPGTIVEIYVARSRGMGKITGAITLENFENVKKDLAKLGEFLKVSKFFLRNFSEEEKDERIFDLLCGFMLILNGVDDVDLVKEAFWWKLFDALGNRPEVMKCLHCGKKITERSKKYFSVRKGGIICPACAPNFEGLIQVNDNQIKLLRIFWGNGLEKMTKVKADKNDIEGLARVKSAFARHNFR